MDCDRSNTPYNQESPPSSDIRARVIVDDLEAALEMFTRITG